MAISRDSHKIATLLLVARNDGKTDQHNNVLGLCTKINIRIK
ncbi:hypothetical protein RFEPED_1271 [Rickettsia felis str. Pedreira]|uniref:Uncharacterized protein n=1 Tax=Rickettsia felis str. Pedreira TaxID=1359196 RepID=A0A0F3MTV0_RICFI|nr:hypothetical protein RFEPED_1271 [Rickettsia felis str. Pedreira]